MESEEENFSSHLPEPLLVAAGGSESRTGGGLQAGGVGGAAPQGLAPASWALFLAIGQHCSSTVTAQGECSFQVHFSKTFQE